MALTFCCTAIRLGRKDPSRWGLMQCGKCSSSKVLVGPEHSALVRSDHNTTFLRMICKVNF